MPKHTNMFKLWRRVERLALALGCFVGLVCIVDWSAVTDQVLAAPVQGPSYQTSRRIVGWRNQTSRRTPRRLQRTARIQGGGGDGDGMPYLCGRGMLVPDNVDYFALYPPDGLVVLDHPRIMAEIVIESCTTDAEREVYLLNPAGQRIKSESSVGHGIIKFFFDLPMDSPLGDYTLYVETITGTLTSGFQVVSPEDAGEWQLEGVPYLRMYNAGTGEKIVDPNLQRGQTLRIEYVGFKDNTAVEAGIYRGLEFDEGTLIDSWEFTTDSNGTYTEEVTIPTDAPAGYYNLIACAIDDCETTLNLLAVSREAGIRPPRLAWNFFELPQDGNTSGNESYTVQRGDYLSFIARRYSVTIAALIQANSIRSADFLYVGQQLTIPPVDTGVSCYPLYTMRSGQTLDDVARFFGAFPKRLAQVNNISDPGSVQTGDQICIPEIYGRRF